MRRTIGGLMLVLLLTGGLGLLLGAGPAAAAQPFGSPAPPLAVLAVQQAQLTGADGAANDRFGWRVALSGDVALVGVPSADVGSNIDQGAAYVFVRSGSAWSQQAKLTAAADGAVGDEFGHDVALYGDTALVGAAGDDVGSNRDQGSAYVFVRSGSAWSQQGKLIAADGAANDWFAQAVGLDGDGAVVGAYGDDVGSNIDQGSAYVFVRSGSAWSQQAQLIAADGAANDQFGHDVALDGDSTLVASPSDDVGSNIDQGSAYVFARAGGLWNQQTKLTASDSAANDWFGYAAVALSGDVALVGACSDDVGSNRDQGSAYVFVRTGSAWSEQAKLTASDGAANDEFGHAVALSDDRALVGSPRDAVGSNLDQGSAYLFARSGSAWGQMQKLTAARGAANDFFGEGSVALSGDVALVGASSDDVGSNREQGSATVFCVDTTRPVTRALANATVRRGRKVTLRLRVDDAVSPQATVTVKIFKGKALKKTLRLGLRATNTEVRYRYLCKLARGRYIWRVYATDLAGNKQRAPAGYKMLTVR